MSLKNLVSKAKRAEIKGNNQGGVDKPIFMNLDYNIAHLTPPDDQLLTLLEGITTIIKQGGGIISEQQKKAFLLTFYRLAFSQEPRAGGCFHPSEISTETSLCLRKMYFQKGSVKPDRTYVKFTSDNRMQRLVDLGTLVHLYIQENLDRLGVLKDFETTVEAPEFGIMGKMDGVVEFYGEDDLKNFYYPEDMVLEIKTINEYGFKALRKPKDEHIKQASIYGHLLGYKKICFVYYNKNTSEHKIFVWDVDALYVENFKKTASELIKKYNSNVRQSRSSDVILHTDIPQKICTTRTTSRAMECMFADYCFKHQCD